MDSQTPHSLLYPVHRLLADERRRQATDRDLLQAFTQRDENDAFTELLRRHGPMVLQLALHLLHHRQDAEDVFQATFLMLARKASSLRKESSAAAWLHRVAWRLAVRSRAAAKRRTAGAGRLVENRQPADEISLRESQELLHQELETLPEHLRLPLVLCYLQERTRDEAARRLGWSLGTLKRRLDQGRKLLHDRLSRRGVTLPAVLSASLLASAEASASLAESTLHLAASVLTGPMVLPAAVAILLAEATSSVKMKAVWGLVLILGAAAGAGAWVYQGQRSEPSTEPRPPIAAAKTKRPSLRTPDAVKKGETMSVSGQVLDPEGKPLSGTQITVLAGIRRLERWIGWSRNQEVLGRSETDREGRFRFTVPRTSSLRNWVVDVVAVHAGFGLSWESFDADADAPTITLRLKPEEIRRGRLLDLQGQPVAGAKLEIVRIQKADVWWIALDGSRHMDFIWPKPIVTDKNGQFLIRGIGGKATAFLLAEHESCSPERLELPAGETKRFVLTPARVLEGRVVYADTGNPAPHVEVGAWGVRGKTDENGHYRLNPARGPIREGQEDGLVMAYAAEGKPYLHTQKAFHWPKTAIPTATVKHRVDLVLPRGVLVRGRVTETDGGKPLAGAYVIYQAQFDNPNAKRAEAGVQNFNNGRNAVTCADDGTFQIACLPGAGYLTVEGPAPDYVLSENGGYDRLFLGKRGGQPWLSPGFAAVDLKIGHKPTEIGFALTKGVALKATISGPDGRQCGDLQVFCKLQTFATSPVQIRGNRVELRGCDAEKALRVMIFDAKNQWGATVEMSKKNAGDKPMSVRLAPCGSVRVRFLDAEGKPLVNFYPGLFLELAPKHGDLRAQTDQIFSPFHKSGPHTDEQGYCTLTALIPGATYQFGYAEIETPFIAKAGEMSKLPDIVMKTRP